MAPTTTVLLATGVYPSNPMRHLKRSLMGPTVWDCPCMPSMWSSVWSASYWAPICTMECAMSRCLQILYLSSNPHESKSPCLRIWLQQLRTSHSSVSIVIHYLLFSKWIQCWIVPSSLRISFTFRPLCNWLSSENLNSWNFLCQRLI